ncbi:ribosome silencing factor [Barrientosiimonas marina]|uniref:Ribosomal silencing factor RsfS n=1 Tax=Lentibacillus kimchii TaxID=1542911 RepID=A0ABW2V0A2_9BACI
MDNQTVIQMVADACDAKQAKDIIALDMEDISLMTDYFLICHGTNERQVQAIARAVKDTMDEAELQVIRMEGFDQARWILVDLGDIVCHIFHHDERQYYNLERLWGDASRVELNAGQNG